jgi:uncharacterized protein GlcG (DUF336 family)
MGKLQGKGVVLTGNIEGIGLATATLLAGIPTLARMAAWGGGLPIKGNGEVAGAIGVSGAPTVQNDIDCASAALALVPGDTL